MLSGSELADYMGDGMMTVSQPPVEEPNHPGPTPAANQLATPLLMAHTTRAQLGEPAGSAEVGQTEVGGCEAPERLPV
jgi:hypothetical protein